MIHHIFLISPNQSRMPVLNLAIETVPTLIRFEKGEETSRSVGWVRKEWSQLLNEPMFGEHLPESRPGCGSLTVMPGVKETLDARFGDLPLNSRTIEIGEFDDPIEQAFERGWSDGLPQVPGFAIRSTPSA